MVPRVFRRRSEVIVVALRTSTSVPPLACVNSRSKLALRVSPSRRVPDRKATPSTMASSVPISLRLEAQRLLTVTDSMASTSEALDAVEDVLGGGLLEAADHLPVSQEQCGVRVAGGDRVVGHHDDRLAQLAGRLAEEAQDLGAAA